MSKKQTKIKAKKHGKKHGLPKPPISELLSLDEILAEGINVGWHYPHMVLGIEDEETELDCEAMREAVLVAIMDELMQHRMRSALTSACLRVQEYEYEEGRVRHRLDSQLDLDLAELHEHDHDHG